jgi:type VI secretion system protein ImpM
MPSCDNVGRYFPLVIAQERSQPPVDACALAHLERWYGVVARAALYTLQDDASAENFEQALADAPSWPVSASQASAASVHDMWCQMFRVLTEREFVQAPWGASSWWPHGETLPGAGLRFWPGLPSGAEFATLLNKLPRSSEGGRGLG